MKTMDIEVVDIRKAKGEGKLKAIADVRVGGMLTLKGFYVMDGENGIFVSPPKKASKDGRWFETISFESDSLKREIQEKILEAYDQEVVQGSGT